MFVTSQSSTIFVVVVCLAGFGLPCAHQSVQQSPDGVVIRISKTLLVQILDCILQQKALCRSVITRAFKSVRKDLCGHQEFIVLRLV